MSKIERFILISLGFYSFLIFFIRVGFLFGLTINTYSFLFSLLIFTLSLITLFFTNLFGTKKLDNFLALSLFLVTTVILSATSVLLSYTYDTSWDGQGYHQTAVIALVSGWNPMYDPTIDLVQRLPSQIFAEGYPSALWEVEASIYALTGSINSAKVVNIAIAIIAAAITFVLLRKLKINLLLSLFLSLLLVLQPIYMIQLLTFMADGFGYQLLIIACASLILIALSNKALWTIPTFLITELLLVSTKYNNLPAALFLGVIFLIIVGNRVLNKEYRSQNHKKYFILGFVMLSLFFSFLPYGRNQLAHKALFYPTNITELSGAITYNNVPLNLRDAHRLSLLFYGIFARTQSQLSGDPRSQENIAKLKIPFLITKNEINDSTALFNNRVGAGGVFFSGIIALSIFFLLFATFKAKVKKERYAIYSVLFSLGIIISLSLLTPAPNLLRYVTQIQFVPFVILIPILAFFREKKVKVTALLILLIVFFNSSIFAYALTQRKISEFNKINEQFSVMSKSQKVYEVKAQHFYSSYIILGEQKVPYVAKKNINCHPIRELLASSTTTQYCIE